MSKRGFRTKTSKKTEPELPQPYTPTASWRLIMPSLAVSRKWLLHSFLAVATAPLLTILGSTLVNGFVVIDIWAGLGVLMEIIAAILVLLNVSATIVLQVDAAAGRTLSVGRMYREAIRFLPRIIGFGAIFGLLFIGGLLLFVVPGLIVMRRYIFGPYCIVEDDLGIRAAMQRSDQLSKPITKQLFSMLLIVCAFGLVTVGLGRLPEPIAFYGSLLATVLPIAYFYLPALRFREAYLNVGRPIK